MLASARLTTLLTAKSPHERLVLAENGIWGNYKSKLPIT
jgi:hypothetical protein